MRTENQKTWLDAPTTLQVIMISVAWVVGVVLLLAAATDFFSENLKNQQLLVVGPLSIMSFVTVIKVLTNYFKND